eukprot:4625726-Pyramimonas_sp.AAC.1
MTITAVSLPQCGTPRTQKRRIGADSGRDVTSEPSPTQHQAALCDDCDDDYTVLESWVDLVKRCTQEAETHMSDSRLDDWVQ